VAEPLGHSVEVLFGVYAKCTDELRNVINQRASAALDPNG